MNDRQRSKASSRKEPPPADVPDVDASQVGFPDDAAREAFIVSAYNEHHAAVFAFLARSTLDRTLAENLLHETYLRLTKEVRQDAAPRDARGVLFRAASTLVIERSHRPPTAARWLGRYDRKKPGRITAPSLEARVMTSHSITDIEQALDGLSIDARVALLLSSDGFTGGEIAAAIGRSTAATRTLLYLARSRVRVRRELFAAERP
jgi:DNA-directed RNA polymerase specialized sigma24 family protein